MKVFLVVSLLAWALVGCTHSGEDTPAKVHKITATPAELQKLKTDPRLARFDGYGSVSFGMGNDDFRNAWKATLNGAVDVAGACSILHPNWIKPLSNFGFMFDKGHFLRYDIAIAGPLAPGGGQVGMSVAQLQSQYGARLAVKPHPFLHKALWLRTDDGKGHVLIFETDDSGRVSRWRVGIPPEIDNEDGCM